MASHARIARFRRYSVPLCLFALVAAVVLVVPPLVLGEVTARTYLLTAAVLVLALASVFPYAVAVGVVTLPLAYAGVGSYAAPRVVPTGAESLSVTAALRHAVAGVAYVLCAAAVGAVGLGADFALSSGSSGLPPGLRPSLLVVGGGVVAGTFVGLQLWRYDVPLEALDRRTILGTVALGALLAPSPVVALWVFGGTAG
jgi:nitric oxide reductase large subunit